MSKRLPSGAPGKSVSLDILFSGFSSRPTSASRSRPSSASKYVLNSPVSHINVNRPKSVPYGNEYYLNDPYNILEQPIREERIKRRKRRSRKEKKTGPNFGIRQSNIKEYDNTKVIEEALMYPEKVSLKLPTFKRRASFAGKNKEKDVYLSNYDWNKEIIEDDDDKNGSSQRSKVSTPSILKQRSQRQTVLQKNELSLKRRVSFHEIDMPPDYKLRKSPTTPAKPVLVTRFANDIMVQWDAPPEFAAKDDSDDSDQDTDSDDDNQMIKEPKRLGFEFHVADSYRNLKLGNGFRRVFSKNRYTRFISIDNLKPGVLYFVRVRTQYHNGWSEFSEPLKVPKFKPQTPPRPKIEVMKQPQVLHVTYHFKAPERDGHQIMNEHEIILRDTKTNKETHRVVVKPQGQKENLQGLDRLKQIELGPVLEKREYTIEIRGRNKLGAGPWSRKRAVPPIRDSPNVVILHRISHISSRGFTAHITSNLGKSHMPIIGFQVIVSYDGISTHARINFPAEQVDQEDRHALRVEDNVKANQHMYVRVRARNKTGYSYRSDEIKIKTLATQLPYYRTNLSDTSDGYNVVISKSQLGTRTFTVRFSWLTPELCGSRLLKQELKVAAIPLVKGEVSSAPTVIELKGDSFSRNCKVDDFFPRTKYKWSLRCLTAVGWSQWTPWNFFETPEIRSTPIVYFFWKGPWMHHPGWYEGHLVGGHPRTSSFAEVKPLDYPEIIQKVAWHKIRITPTPGDLSRTIKLGSPSKVIARKRLCDLSRVYDFDKHIDQNDDEVVDSSSEEEEENYEEEVDIAGQKDDGYEEYMTNFRVNNIKRIHVVKPADLVDELTGHAKDVRNNFLPQPKGKNPYTKRNVYGFQKRVTSVNKNLVNNRK